MADYTATVTWERAGARFADNRYSRAHRWRFDGGAVIPASSSPHVVPAPLSDPAAVDPEEAFVASLSSCHMLFFLYFAAKGGFVVDTYEDGAVGHMEKNAAGRPAITRVVLRPRVAFSGDRTPSPEEVRQMHDRAHHECYIANSVRTEVSVDIP
jgi:organic hydroperoxide reductase OsmC/OhrA